jgi:predicted short-subunit dehydrogenase-like oxidoreductase (DUF2520 family)
MRQVPRYLLIGNGRVARHFQHYFSLLNVAFETWNRKQTIDSLTKQAADATHILLLISDKAIDDFIATHLSYTQAKLIHFSGSLLSQYAYGAHPLMSFTETLYDLEHYQKIPFVLDHDAPEFETLLPCLSNPHFSLHKSLKPKYHALCVLSGNFSCLLWQKIFSSFESELHLPHEIAFPFLTQQTNNLLLNHKNALTGPLVRDDYKTIEKNINSLANDPFQEIYKAFVNCYQKLKSEELV